MKFFIFVLCLTWTLSGQTLINPSQSFEDFSADMRSRYDGLVFQAKLLEHHHITRSEVTWLEKDLDRYTRDLLEGLEKLTDEQRSVFAEQVQNGRSMYDLAQHIVRLEDKASRPTVLHRLLTPFHRKPRGQLVARFLFHLYFLFFFLVWIHVGQGHFL